MSIGVGVGVGIAFSQAPAAASFDPNFELSPDPGFDTPGAWTVLRCTVSGSACNVAAPGFPWNATATATGTLGIGTYHVTAVIANYVGGLTFIPSVAGSTSSVAVSGNGTVTADIVVTTVNNQTVRCSGASSGNYSVTSMSVKQIA